VTPNKKRAPSEHAAELREQARKDCAKAQWRACLDRLDEADTIDPDQANDPGVRALRVQAQTALDRVEASAPR
jgi:hypothetical protein